MAQDKKAYERAVWKVEIHPGRNDFNLPQGAQVKHIREMDDRAFMWLEVRPELDLEPRTFQVIGTGWTIHPDEAGLEYQGTFIINDNVMTTVWHVYE